MSNPVYIQALAHYHPKTVLDNSFFEKIIETTDEWIYSKVGIRERRFMSDYSGAYPVFEISRRAVDALVHREKYPLSEIDMVISCSSTEDLQYPSPANMLSEYYGLNVPAFHMKNGCSTVLFAMQAARGFLSLGPYKNILLVNGEPFTTQVDYSDRKSCILFGDASTAMVISKTPGLFEIEELTLGGQGSRLITSTGPGAKPQKSIYQVFKGEWGSIEQGGRGCFHQQGKEVFEFVTKMMPSSIGSFLSGLGLNLNEVDYFIGHQSNMAMLQSLCETLAIPDHKHLRNIEHFGNVSSAGWVTVLSQAIEKNLIQETERVLVSVFGAGLAWANLLLKRRG